MSILRTNAKEIYHWIYLVLISLTLLTWVIAESAVGDINISLFVLTLALIKGWLLGDYFMDLKLVTSAWRWLAVIWLVLVTGLIALAFSLGA